MKTMCGADCSKCGMKQSCKGCIETDGHPFGGDCITAECLKKGGTEHFCSFKAQAIREFNSLGISDMPQISELVPLCGAYVNLEYTLPNGQRVKLLEDHKIYLGYQVEKINSERCYGLVADHQCLLVCEYGCNGSDPHIVLYKKRKEEQ